MLKTEERNSRTMHIDTMDTAAMLRIMNEESENAVRAVEAEIDTIAEVCDKISQRVRDGGKIFYVGAGTSGRLGVLDAVECPPTFGVEPGLVVGIIAGGEKCMTKAAEGEEDDENAGREDLKAHGITSKDSVVGISAAGGAAYVVGALRYAAECGAYTVSLSSNYNTPIQAAAETAIITDTGAEAVTGSTRMKAGTAQKLVLNMLSTSVMIKTGRVYENMMINLKPSNKKLRGRMVGIVCEILKCDAQRAEKLLNENGWSIRKAVESGK